MNDAREHQDAEVSDPGIQEDEASRHVSDGDTRARRDDSAADSGIDGDDGGSDGDDENRGSDGGDDGNDGEGEPPLDEVDVRELLRSALDKPLARRPPSVLGEVQNRLRDETQGRFFGDGWSTAAFPRETYIVTSALMLLLIIVAWLLLGPYDVALR
jgi:hypothetical protein